MHKHTVLSLALVATMLVPAACRADDATVRKQIKAQMARFQDAFRRKDLAALRAIATPDFTMKSKNGVVSSRREAEAAMAADMKAIIEITSWTLKINAIKVKGDVANLVVDERMTAKLASGLSGRRVSVSRLRMKETWVKMPNGWRYKKAEALESANGPEGMTFVESDQLDNRNPVYVAARKAIDKQYAVYQNAIRKKDFRTAMSTMEPGITIVYPNGRTFNRRQTEVTLQQTIGATRSIPEWELKIIHLSVNGNTAVASIGERMVTIFVDFRGTLHKQTLLDFYQDTWVKSSKGWRLKNTLVSNGTVTVDGKTADPFK